MVQGPKRLGASLCGVLELSSRNWQRISGDAALLFCAGFLAAVLRRPEINGVLLTLPAVSWLICLPPLVLITAVLPLFNRLPIHPVIVFSIFAPILSGGVTEPEVYLHYAAWVVYWHVSLLISPVSIINVTIDSVFPEQKFSLRASKSLWSSFSMAILACGFLMGIYYAVETGIDIEKIMTICRRLVSDIDFYYWRVICRRLEWAC
ncbi:hypothetical protein [Methylocaldum marinum]|uniref:hypothetical protein n=1 Tax=Methylocaldum marinum TaxID=1432792 RepID=UPI0011AE4B4A|nr:hypothetical protein [Methylocaldum marinum]